MFTYARSTIAEKQRHHQIHKAIKNNQHTLVQMNSQEFIDYVLHTLRLQGKEQQQIVEWFENAFQKAGVNPQSWEQYKASIKTGTGFIPWGVDVVGLGAIALEMKRDGNTFSKYYVKTYNGKPNVVFKGYSGFRKHLTGTKYLASNPKVVSFGIGKLGVAKSIKTGFVVTVIISATFHAFEQMLNDQATWHDFVGGMAVDVGIAAAASGIAWGAVATYIGGTVAMAAVGPMLAVVVVGAALMMLTTAFVDSDALSKNLSDSLREAEQQFKQGLLNVQYEINRVERMFDADPIGFIHRLFGIPYFGTQFR
jgi:hypothetical protein